MIDEQRRRRWIDALSSLQEKLEARQREAEEARDRPPLLGNFAYVCTRCRARRAKLFGPETVERLMRMGLSEIARFMEESTYRDEVDRLATRHRGVDLVEYALNDNLASTYREVLSWCRGKPRYLLTAYLKRWDKFNIKTILRSKFSGIDPEEVQRELVVAGAMDEDDLEPLLALESVPQVVEALEGTEWYPPLQAALDEEEREPDEPVESLTEIENALDRHYYRQLVDSIPRFGRANKRYERFVRDEIDIVNLRTILRLNRDGYGAEEIRPLTLDGGRTIAGELSERLMEETDLEGTARVLRETDLGERIADRLDVMATEGDIHGAIWALERLHVQHAGRGKNLYPLSMLPIMDFLMAKKAEVDTIRIIARGKEHQLPDAMIQEQVVVA